MNDMTICTEAELTRSLDIVADCLAEAMELLTPEEQYTFYQRAMDIDDLSSTFITSYQIVKETLELTKSRQGSKR